MDSRFYFNPVMAGWKMEGGGWMVSDCVEDLRNLLLLSFLSNPAVQYYFRTVGTYTAVRLYPLPSSGCLCLGSDPENRFQLLRPIHPPESRPLTSGDHGRFIALSLIDQSKLFEFTSLHMNTLAGKTSHTPETRTSSLLGIKLATLTSQSKHSTCWTPSVRHLQWVLHPRTTQACLASSGRRALAAWSLLRKQTSARAAQLLGLTKKL